MGHRYHENVTVCPVFNEIIIVDAVVDILVISAPCSRWYTLRSRIQRIQNQIMHLSELFTKDLGHYWG